MKLNITQLDSRLQKAAKCANSVLKLQFAVDGVPVVAVHAENGFSVKKSDGKVLITYSKISDFLRALLYLACGKAVEQRCAFDEIGMMIDCSRNAVPKTENLKKFIATLACFGYTYIYLYTEDTYELENNPYFGYLRGRYTAEEIRELDAYCAELGVELIPCIQTLAHLYTITRYKTYENVFDFYDILLCGEEKTYKLIDDMFSTLEHTFTSRKVNIGMDEAHMLGLGRYLDKHGYTNKFDIMFDHLKRVLDIAEKHGFSCSMWSDMFFRMAAQGEYYQKFDSVPEDLLGKIPSNVELIYWDYYSTDYRHYIDMLESHFKLSERIAFAGGAWKWFGWTPLNDYSVKATKQAVRACREKGIKNYFMTSWGDNGAEAMLHSVLPSLFYMAQAAYGDEDEKRPFARLTGVSFDDFMKLDLPNRANNPREYQRNNSSKFFLYDDLLFGTFDSMLLDGQSESYGRIAKELGAVKAGGYKYIFRMLENLCSVLEVKVKLSEEIKKAYAEKDKARLKEMSADFSLLLRRTETFYKNFAAAWEKENKPFGFEIQDHRFGGLIARIKAVAKKVADFADGKVSAIPELEEKHLPCGYFAEDDFSEVLFNDWCKNVSNSVM